MLLVIIIGLLILPPVGAGIAVGVKQDAYCRAHHMPTRLSGAMLDMYCDPPEHSDR